jgi:arsenate reductase-like glutaredoxin family protein
VELTERDMFKHPLTEAELGALIGGRPVRDFFSFKSPSFRKLGLDREGLTDSQMLSMMSGEPRLIRRPLVAILSGTGVTGNHVIVGNAAAAFEQAFG